MENKFDEAARQARSCGAVNLLVLTPLKVDSTSFYRAYGVFGDLRNKFFQRTGVPLNIVEKNDISWPDLVLCDAVFMQRPYSDAHAQLAAYINSMGIPLWVDYDDNLFEVGKDNQQAWQVYASRNVQDNMRMVIGVADVVTVSTMELRRSLKALNERVEVVPNAFNDLLFAHTAKKGPKWSPKRAMWRGSGSHVLDLAHYAAEISEQVERQKDWTFEFRGYMPWFLNPAGNVKYVPAVDPMVYHLMAWEEGPAAAFVPLVPSHFNKCKSNIAWIEATMFGAACLVPDWEEWRLPGAVLYKSQHDFGGALKDMLSGKVDLEKLRAESWEAMSDGFRLSSVNELRVDALEGIL